MLVRKDSIELLKFMLNNQLDQQDPQLRSSVSNSTKGIGLYDLMTKMHTPRWLDHPNSARQKQKLEMHLKSLVRSENLEWDNKHQYIVTEKALQTIEKYEEDERRHKDIVRVQVIIASLTAIIALITLFQQIR